MKRGALSAAALVLLVICAGRRGALHKALDVPSVAAASYPAPAPPDIRSCQVPKDVSGPLPSDLKLYQQRPFFDTYSWQAFAALTCDAQPGARGLADSTGGRDGSGPRVFQTFKSAWEVFHPGSVSSDPTTYGDETYNPCRGQAKPGELVLASTSKFFDTEQAGESGVAPGTVANPRVPEIVQAGPLLAQNTTWVRYLAQYNEKSFQHILEVLHGTPANSEFPTGSVNIKSAWVDMKDLNSRKFYVRNAWIPADDGKGCVQRPMGLVGMHIVQKTPTRRNWIWSTIEHVDNVPDSRTCHSGGPSYTFNKGDCKKMPDSSPFENNSSMAPVNPFNVVRLLDINGDTTKLNTKFQGLFSSGSVWWNYELVMTQWPFGQKGAEDFFPHHDATSAIANTTMETFFQAGLSARSCMDCHGLTGGASDFVWSLQIERPASRTKAFGDLQKVLHTAGISLQ